MVVNEGLTVDFSARMVELVERGRTGEALDFLEESYPWEGREREAVGWLTWWLFEYEQWPYYESMLTKPVRQVFPELAFLAQAGSARFWARSGLGDGLEREQYERGIQDLLGAAPCWQAVGLALQAVVLDIGYPLEAIRLLEPQVGSSLVRGYVLAVTCRGLSLEEMLDMADREDGLFESPFVAVVFLRALKDLVPSEGVRADLTVGRIVGLFPESDLVLGAAVGLAGRSGLVDFRDDIERLTDEGAQAMSLMYARREIDYQSRGRGLWGYWRSSMRFWKARGRILKLYGRVIEVADRMSKRGESG